MNNLDPSLAKYLSKSKQDIYEEYHGKKRKKKSKTTDTYTPVASGSGSGSGNGLLIADDADDAGWGGSNPWNRASGMVVDEDEDDRQPGGCRSGHDY